MSTPLAQGVFRVLAHYNELFFPLEINTVQFKQLKYGIKVAQNLFLELLGFEQQQRHPGHRPVSPLSCWSASAKAPSWGGR